MEIMTKKELVKAVAEKMEVTQKDTGALLEAFIETIGDTLAAGTAVKISGFVTFEPCEVEARVGRNPQTGEDIQVAAHTRIKVKLAKALKDKVR